MTDDQRKRLDRPDAHPAGVRETSPGRIALGRRGKLDQSRDRSAHRRTVWLYDDLLA